MFCDLDILVVETTPGTVEVPADRVGPQIRAGYGACLQCGCTGYVESGAGCCTCGCSFMAHS